MRTVQEIETAIEKLTPQEQRELAASYEERQALLNMSAMKSAGASVKLYIEIKWA